MSMQLEFEHSNYTSMGIIRGWMPPFVNPNKTKTKVVKKPIFTQKDNCLAKSMSLKCLASYFH